MSAVIDLQHTYSIKCEENRYAPLSERYEAIDVVTFDHEPSSTWHLIGRGATKREATADLLQKIADARAVLQSRSQP